MKNLVLVLSLMGIGACTNISPGHVGVRINKCSGGGVDDEPLGVGYHSSGPCVDIEEYPTFQQTLILTKSDTEGSKSNDEITVTSSEGLGINLDISLSYTIEEKKVPGIYKKFRTDLDTIGHKYIKQSIREALQEIFSKYTAQQLYSDKKEVARLEAEKLLITKLILDGFHVTQFTINSMRIPPEVTAAINAKVAMIQDAQRSEQELRKTTAIAAQTVARAEGAAKAKRIEADSIAYYNQQLEKSLSPALVEYIKAKSWDGHLSQVSGGSGTLINLK